jgi:hypothetical protein
MVWFFICLFFFQYGLFFHRGIRIFFNASSHSIFIKNYMDSSGPCFFVLWGVIR